MLFFIRNVLFLLLKGAIEGSSQISINNYIYLFSRFFSVFQICLKKNIFIPRFCYHSKLQISGNCRMCLVEEKKSLKPLASCSILIASEMVLFTKTSLVKKAREGVIEYLLANHPLDCPICDQGGECDLQDQAMVFGGDRGRFYELKKRDVENKNISILIKTSLNRCIQCARCTRFLDFFGGNNKKSQLSLLGRGLNTEISFYSKNFLYSEISGNIIDLCPVGALTSKNSSFKTRSWDLFSTYSIDIFDSLGSDIQVDYWGTSVLRILPKLNENVNSEWITDKIRFFFDSLNFQRLLNPTFNCKTSSYIHLSYLNSFFLIKENLFMNINLFNTKYLLDKFFLGNYLDFFDLSFFKNLLSKINSNFTFLNNNNASNIISNDFRRLFLFNKNNLIKKKNNGFLFIGSNPRFESPILNIHLKLLVKNQSIFIAGYLSNLNYNFIHLGNNIFNLTRNILNNNYNIVLNSYNTKFFKFLGDLFLNNINLINNNINDVSISELNFKLNNLDNFTFPKFLKNFINSQYFISSDNFIFRDFFQNTNSFSVYQGSHGDFLSSQVNLILPHKIFLNRPLTFLNTFGFLRKNDSSFFLATLSDIRDDLFIFKGLFHTFFKSSTNFLKEIKIDSFLRFNSLIDTTGIYFNSIEFFKKNSTSKEDYYWNFSFYYYNFLIPSLVNNFFHAIGMVKFSPSLQAHAKKFNVKNDFLFNLSFF